MSRLAHLSLLGLYNWDPTLFDLMQLPDGIQKETLVENLLAETAELETLYADPAFMKAMIGVWSAKQLDVWTKLYNTTVFDYNPIENYNRMETGTETGSGSTTHSGTDTREHDIRTGGQDTQTASGTNTHRVAGFNAPAGTYVDQAQDETSGNTSTRYGRTEGHDESVTHGEKIDSSTRGGHTLHAHGNIGVMSTQQMIEQEREVDLFNIYDTIITDFRNRFCLLVY